MALIPEQACEAALPYRIGPALIWMPCGEPAVAVHEYGCIHEHIARKATCAAHAPEPDIVGCQLCWDAGHECPLAFRLVDSDTGGVGE